MPNEFRSRTYFQHLLVIAKTLKCNFMVIVKLISAVLLEKINALFVANIEGFNCISLLQKLKGNHGVFLHDRIVTQIASLVATHIILVHF